MVPEMIDVEEVPLLQLYLAADDVVLCPPVALDDHVPHPGLQDGHADISPLDLDVCDAHHDVAVLVVALLDAVEVVTEEGAVEDRPHLGEHLLHQLVAGVDGVSLKGNGLNEGVLLHKEGHGDRLAPIRRRLRTEVDIHEGEEPLIVDGFNILLKGVPVQGLPLLCADDTQDVFRCHLVVAGDADDRDNRGILRLNCRRQQTGQQQHQQRKSKEPPTALLKKHTTQGLSSPFPILRWIFITGSSFFKARAPV